MLRGTGGTPLSWLDALRRVISAIASTVQSDLLTECRKEGLGSIGRLSAHQPASHAAQALMPARGIRFFTIAGSLPGASNPGGGVTPLASAILPGAEWTTIGASGHKVYVKDEVIAQVINILREL